MQKVIYVFSIKLQSPNNTKPNNHSKWKTHRGFYELEILFCCSINFQFAILSIFKREIKNKYKNQKVFRKRTTEWESAMARYFEENIKIYVDKYQIAFLILVVGFLLFALFFLFSVKSLTKNPIKMKSILIFCFGFQFYGLWIIGIFPLFLSVLMHVKIYMSLRNFCFFFSFSVLLFGGRSNLNIHCLIKS